ncbi:MAG: hypothetical protein LBN07_01520 [Christensenellaceae bacterium]|jgi:hypothetical protein|nr:hypothetical protein [Christensenellaceae bacterium]
MGGKICWNFPLLGTGNKQGYTNAGITVFEGRELTDNLVREICQNSLDAKNEHTDEPVIVEFELLNVEKSKYALFKEFEDRIKGCEEFWKDRTDDKNLRDFLARVKVSLSQTTIPFMIMRDFNTKGLIGVKSQDEKSVWEGLANMDGISVDKGDNGGGSFGIGKNAPFAYSSLSMVFYNTYAEDGGKAFQGVARAATLYDEQRNPTQGIGKYLYISDDKKEWHPIFPDDKCDFRDLFPREKIGTDIIVVGFKIDEENDWKDKFVKALLNNFTLAFIKNKLKVRIIDNGKPVSEISNNTIENMLTEKYKTDAEVVFAREAYMTLTAPTEKRTIKILEENDVTVYIKFDDKFSNYKVHYRETGMRIDAILIRSLLRCFIVVEVNKSKNNGLSKLLRDSEPQRHNQWDYKRIKDKERSLQCKKALDNIKKEIQTIIDEYNRITISESLDGDIGEYLPNAADVSTNRINGDDEFNSDLKIKDHPRDKNGRIFICSSLQKSNSAQGVKNNESAVKDGKKRHRHRKKRLKVVTPGTGTTKGVTLGDSKLKITTPDLTDHRIYQIRENLYKAIISSSTDYENIYIRCQAARDDLRQEPLVILAYTYNKNKTIVKANKIGPITLKANTLNEVFIEFDTKESLAIETIITKEVENG